MEDVNFRIILQEMRTLFLCILIITIASCQQDKEVVERDESQILNMAFEKAIGSDTTFRSLMKHHPAPIPVIPFTDKTDSAEYLVIKHWRDSVIRVLDTASLFVKVYRKNESMGEFYVQKLLDSIKKKGGDAGFNSVLITLCDQNLSPDTIQVSVLKPTYNFKIYTDNVAPLDEIRDMGSISFSKIAFSNQKDTACVLTSTTCGEFCSKGDIHFFVKRGNEWIYCKKLVLWTP